MGNPLIPVTVSNFALGLMAMPHRFAASPSRPSIEAPPTNEEWHNATRRNVGAHDRDHARTQENSKPCVRRCAR